MTVRLRPGVHYAPIQDGVYFATQHGSFVLRGPASLFRLVDSVVPALEDGVATDDQRIRPLLTALRAKGLLLESVPRWAAAAREQFGEALAELESWHPDPYAAFQRVRSGTVLVSGPAEVVLPAARGLHRAGVGTLVLAVPEPAAVEAAAARLGARTEALTTDGIEVDAAVAIVTNAAEYVVKRLPESCVVVPVRLGDRVHLVGERPGLAARAERWADAEVPRPTADALAGALAGRLAFRALSGMSDGDAYVVHGPALAADLVSASAAELSDTWRGALATLTPRDLPQLPLALAEVEHRTELTGTVVAWGADQREAATAAALAALRAQSAHRTGEPGAAGTSERRWLLDGALRQLVDRAEPVCRPVFDQLPKATRILWRSIEDFELLDPVTLDVLATPGLGWRLGRVTDPATGDVVGSGWGRDADEAVEVALSVALARLQTFRVRGADLVPAIPDTTVLLRATDNELADVSGWTGERWDDPLLAGVRAVSGPVRHA